MTPRAHTTPAAPRTDASVKVLIVDDSPFMQRRLAEILQRTADIKVIGCANNGIEAISLAERLRPDVITMDINMPKMDGLMAIGHIMRYAPRPIVVVSSYTRKCAQAAIQALDLGAIDIVEKSCDTGVSLDLDRSAEEIVRKVRQASRIRVVRTGGRGASLPPPRSSADTPPRAQGRGGAVLDIPAPHLIAIGSSTGGPAALRDLFRALPSPKVPPILVVQHLPPNFTRELAEQLCDVTCIPVVEAIAGQRLQPGQAYIAPGHHHLELDPHLRVVLTTDPPVKHCRPSVDVTLRSVAKQCGAQALGIVLTGMGDDGADGALAMKQAGACVIAQDEESCLVYGMPRAVVEAGAATREMSLEQIKSLLADVARKHAAEGADLLASESSRVVGASL